MHGQYRTPIMVVLLTAMALYLPLSNVLPQATQQNATVAQSLPTARGVVPSSTDGTSSPDVNKLGQGAAVKLLCDFFGPNNLLADNPQAAKDKSDSCSFAGSTSGVIQDGSKRYQVEHIIATIPDPQASRLDYLFDHHLDAMQRAIEHTNYILDRYSLPWEKQKNPQTVPTQVTNVSTHQGITMVTQPTMPSTPLRHDYTREPGVMLFRHIHGDGGKLLLLFLVGETPTRGIHKAAFLNALDQIEWLRQDVPLKIRVLGPTFSGSAVSLALSLRHWLKLHNPDNTGRIQVQIISGSATAIDKEDFLSQVGDEKHVTFHATVRHEAEVRRAFMHYLSAIQSQDRRSRIAILSEANTAYGQRVRRDMGDESISLTFPLHISQLRAEVAKTRPARSEMSNGILTLSPNKVPLPMGESAEAQGDVVPLFSPLATASIELVLSHMLSAIHRERIRYIGLFATDVQDHIFLTRELRHHAPNTVLFTFGADLLYLHSETNLDFQGMLVITTYPLFSPRIWSFPFKGMAKRIRFPTPSAQGCYNAMLALLGQPDQMIEYGRPFDPNSPGALRQPVSWLSIVGRTNIWPVRLFAADPVEKDPKQAVRNSYTYPVVQQGELSTDVSIGYRYCSPLLLGTLLFVGLLCLMPSVLLLLHLMRLKLNHQCNRHDGNPNDAPELTNACFFARVQRWLNTSYWMNQSWLGKLFSLNTQYRYNRRLYLFSCCVSLMMISLITSIVSLLPSWLDFGPKVRWESDLWHQIPLDPLLQIPAWVILVSTPVLLLTIAILLFWVRFQQLGQDAGSRTLGCVSLAISLVMFTLACMALYWVAHKAKAPSTPEAFFFLLRATELRSGVSLLLPWFCITLAAFVSCFSIVRRLDLAERSFDLDLNCATPETPSFTSLRELVDTAKKLLSCPVWAVPRVLLISMLIFMVYFLYFALRYIPSIEGPQFDTFFIVAFCLVPLLLSGIFLRLFWLALALKRLLKRLGWHPLFHVSIDDKDPAFHMLPKISLMSSTPTYTALSSSVTLAQGFFRLKQAAENRGFILEPLSDLSPIQSKVAVAGQRLHEAMQDDASGKWREALASRCAVQKAMSEAASVIAVWMEPHWAELHDQRSTNRTLIKQGRLFLMSHIAAFLQYSLVQLQNLAGLGTAGLLLILIAETSYPFQPRDTLLLFGWVAILVAVLVMIFIFVQLSRDKVISLLSGTSPNQLNWTSDLVFRLFIHGVLPILALLGAQFPEALQNLLSWFSFLHGKGY